MELSMKKIFAFIVLAAVLVTSCHEPEYVAPTASRSGITSLTAFFATGPYVDMEWGRLEITDPDETYFVIPLSYYYPSDSENKVGNYQIKVRVRASIANNCKIDPPLTILDLTEENKFTFTDAAGASREITITGKLVKSSVCRILSIEAGSPAVTGVVDEINHKVWLPTDADLSSATASVVFSAHTSISPDPSAARDYNEGVTYTITSEDGDTKVDYLVVRGTPPTIDYGYSEASMERLFNLDPATAMGLPDFGDPLNVSMGVVEGKLVVNLADGNAPRYYHQVSGAYLGTINLGAANPSGAIASDEAGNLLICNYADIGQTLNIWRTASVADAPVLLHSFTNDQDVPAGTTMKVIGDIDDEAVITIVYDGIAEVTTSSRFRAVHISGGAVVSDEVLDLAGTGLAWGAGANNGTCIVSGSPDLSGGWYGAAYDENALYWFKKDLTVGSRLNGMGPDNELMYLNGNVDANNLDSKRFNNARYMVLFASSHFPSWWPGPQIYVYDISSGAIAGTNVWDSSALVFSIDNNNMYSLQNEKGATKESTASGDVILSPSPDGYKLYMYYYDHYAQMLGGFCVDCLKR